jgi:hypothetical protein
MAEGRPRRRTRSSAARATRAPWQERLGNRTNGGRPRANARSARSARAFCARCSKRPSTCSRTSSTDVRLHSSRASPPVTSGRGGMKHARALVAPFAQPETLTPETDPMLTRRSFLALAAAFPRSAPPPWPAPPNPRFSRETVALRSGAPTPSPISPKAPRCRATRPSPPTGWARAGPSPRRKPRRLCGRARTLRARFRWLLRLRRVPRLPRADHPRGLEHPRGPLYLNANLRARELGWPNCPP